MVELCSYIGCLLTFLLIITSIRWKSDDPEVVPQVPISILTF